MTGCKSYLEDRDIPVAITIASCLLNKLGEKKYVCVPMIADIRLRNSRSAQFASDGLLMALFATQKPKG